MTRVEPQWVQHMREALEEFVQDVRQSLPEQPSVADIERTLLEAQRQLMRDLMQSVVDNHAPPPPQDLGNAMEVSGTAVSTHSSPVGEGKRPGAVPQASRKRKS